MASKLQIFEPTWH